MPPVRISPVEMPNADCEPARQQVIEPGDRYQYSHRDHGARHGVAQRREPMRGERDQAAARARRVRDEQRERHGARRGDAGQRDAVEDQPRVARVRREIAAAHRELQQDGGRQHETDDERQRAGDDRAAARAARAGGATSSRRAAAAASKRARPRLTRSADEDQRDESEQARRRAGRRRRDRRARARRDRCPS